MQQQSQKMRQLLKELNKLQKVGPVVDDAKIELKGMPSQVVDLQLIPATQNNPENTASQCFVHIDLFPDLWGLKSRPRDAVLSCLPAMPWSPHALI